MAITVTLPIQAPTGLTATLVAGGSLLANTTYYYVVIAYDQHYTSPNGVIPYHSPLSEESSFTTDNINKSVKINWTNVAGATRYQILISTTSGNYTNSGGYGTTTESVGNNMTSGIIGYTITALSIEPYVIHTCQVVNALPGNINKNLGIIKVDFTTAGNYNNLTQIYNDIVAQGFGDYVFYDGYNFVCKGWFFANSNASVGSFVIQQRRLTFIKGGIINYSNTYTMQFGSWISDTVGANYTTGCAINILNMRMSFASSFDKIKMYGCLLTNHLEGNILTEIKQVNSYFTGWYIPYNTVEYKDNIMGVAMRGNNSVAKDLKWWQTNNFGNAAHIRLRIWTYASLPYFKGGKFYDCDFLLATGLWFYNGSVAYSESGYYTDFYDCEWPARPDGMLYLYYNSIVNPTTLTSNQIAYVNYTLSATVLDEAGNALSDVNVSALDASGNAVNFIEYDTTIDKLVTGNVYAGSVTTDENGQIGYYINAYQVGLNPANTTYPNSYDTITTVKYPFTITFSKAGYRDYTVILEELKKKTDMTLTLEDYTAPYPKSRIVNALT